MSYSSEVLADNPVSYWRLGESSGTAAVNQTAGADGTYVNAPTLGVAGALTGDADTAVTFNGTTQSVTTSSTLIGNSDSYSIEAWFKTSSTSAKDIYAESGDLGNFCILQTNDPATGNLKFIVRANSGGGDTSLVYSSASVVDGEWHHVVVTKTLTEIRLYLDGSLVAGPSGAPGTVTNLYGAIATGLGGFFAGTIDEVAIYDTALSATRVLAHYDAASGAAAPTHPFTSVTIS